VGRTARPQTPHALAQLYGHLGGAIASTEACLLSALDALDPRTGGGVSQPAAAYAAVRQRAFDLLREAGRQFNRIEPAFGPLVHGPGAWPNQPVIVQPDRGDGRPLYNYVNSYKKPPGLSDAQRRAEHQERVERFASRGGRYDAIEVATPGVFEGLEPGVRYDYVLSAKGTLRLHPNVGDGPKPGHSLLATGGPEFVDEPVLLAGELWVYKDTAGDVEAVVVANNSGHFKPAFDDLPNATPTLEGLGLPSSKIVYFGGPNNLPSLMEEIGQNCGLGDLSALLPPSPLEILQRLSDPPREDLVSVRTWPG
jgi:hypothetical protein